MEPKYLTIVVSAFVSGEELNLDKGDIDATEHGEGHTHATLPFNAAAGMNTNFMLNLAAEEAVKDAIKKGLLPAPNLGPADPTIYPTKSE